MGNPTIGASLEIRYVFVARKIASGSTPHRLVPDIVRFVLHRHSPGSFRWFGGGALENPFFP